MVGYYPEDRCLFLFIALRWMQRPERVMVWVAENIQACLRIFRRAQHQWLARDILHQAQGVFEVFVLWPTTGLIRPIRLIRLIRGRKTKRGKTLYTQVAPVGRRTCGMLIPRVTLRSALGYVLATLSRCLPWQYDERTGVFLFLSYIHYTSRTSYLELLDLNSGTISFIFFTMAISSKDLEIR